MSKNIWNAASIVIELNLSNMSFMIFLNFYQCWKIFVKIESYSFIIDLFSCRFLNEIYDSILIIVNRFTKYVIYISIRKDWKRKNLANALINSVFKYFDMFVLIVNNKKVLFISHFWFTFCYHLSMSLRYNIVFYFQTNEQTKRQNQILKQYLKRYVTCQQNNWTTLL